MNEGIFRKKSLERVKSPENLDDYIQVSNPGVWLLLVSVIVLLIGACIWGALGNINSTVSTTVCIEDGKAFCYVSEGDISEIKTGLTVEFSEQQASILSVGEKGEMGYICSLSDNPGLADGFYQGSIVVKSYKPLSFILN